MILYNIHTMPENYFIDLNFDQSDDLAKGEYEKCIFKSCNFGDCDFSNFKFISCIFIGCNLSLVKIKNTVFNDVTFNECKLLGLHFDTCNVFGLSFSFDGCQLNHASFYKLNIKRTTFKNTILEETDFAEADLTGSVFDHCNLSHATFDRTVLEKTDFRTSYNFSIDPEKNRIKKAKFSTMGLSGLLEKYDIEIDD